MARLIVCMLVFTALAPSAAVAAPPRFDAPTRWIQIPFGTPAAVATRRAFGRVDANATADLVVYNADRGEAYLALSNGHGFGPAKLAATGLPKFVDEPFEITLADINGDGLDDLVVMNHGADNIAGAATAVVAFSTGAAFTFSGDPVKNASWCASYQVCLAGDVSGDRRSDLVAFTPNFGTVWASPSQGAAIGPNTIWNNYFCLRGEKCALGDVDGDGRADAILFKPNAPEGQKGNVLWARSTGSSFVDVKYGHGYFCIGAEQCLVGDVNGDKRADIVLTKGWGTAGQTLEVLVSLSDGTRFVNAAPFEWARPPFLNPAGRTFGSFSLADVSGDGRADLVEDGLISVATGGGGQRTTAYVVDVFVVTDRAPAPQNPPSTSNPAPAAAGYSAVKVFNCHPDQRRLSFWNLDSTSGTSAQAGPVDAMYSESGYCPDPNDEPETFALADGHVHLIVAVDPLAIGCEGRTDPNVAGCVNNSAIFRGVASGPVCQWILSAQAPSCIPSLQTKSLQLIPAVPAAPGCASGHVWREARAGDYVCVTPEVRAETVDENLRAAERRSPNGGAYGPNTCRKGFVWREAFEGDFVCVTPESRERAYADNAAAPRSHVGSARPAGSYATPKAKIKPGSVKNGR